MLHLNWMGIEDKFYLRKTVDNKKVSFNFLFENHRLEFNADFFSTCNFFSRKIEIYIRIVNIYIHM